MEKRSRGEKFTEKYGVASATIYRGNPESLKIPPRGHVLHDPTAPTAFDEIRVAAIDRDGKMTTPIEVWTDPEKRLLWVLDGRGRFLDVQEVNRRRAAEGRELVEPLIVPFDGDEKAAVARVREKNYHRRAPSPSGMAVDLLTLRKQGYTWEACAGILHVETKDAEQWGRKLLPLARCCPEVREAVDAGEIPKSAASKFGGPGEEGTETPPRSEQIEQLEAMRAKRATKPARGRGTALTPANQKRILAALSNGAKAELGMNDTVIASAVAATLARVGGNKEALSAWPKVEAVVEAVLAPKVRAPKLPKEKKPRGKTTKESEART